jgi:hypothetical protein
MPPPVKDDVQKELDELDHRLSALKILYDKYFLGMEKLEPQRERADVNKTIIDLGSRFIRNTGAKFRRDTLKNKFLTYQRFWDRILKQIEDGTYKGHKVKAELHERERAERAARRRGGDSQTGADPTLEAENGDAAAPAPMAAAAPRPAAAPGAPPAAAAAKDPITRIYDQFVAAKKKANESTDGLTADKMATIIKQQTVALKQKYNCKSVEFRVVVEDGKAKLKAIPK